MFQQLKERFFSSGGNSNSSHRKSIVDLNAPLTQREIDYIRLTWSYLRTDIANFKVFGADLFIRFFSLYPDYQRQFKSFKDIPVHFADLPTGELRINKKLLAHGTFVMYTLGMLVDHLEEPATLEVMLKRLARNHYRRRVNLTAFALLREAFLDQLIERLGSEVVGPREVIAWRKAWTLILAALEREFAALEVDVVKRTGSYYQLSAAHRSARHSMLREYVTAAAHSSRPPTAAVQTTKGQIRGGLPPRSPVVSSSGNTELSTTQPSSSTKGKRSLKLLMFKPFKLVRKSLQHQQQQHSSAK